MSANPKSEYAMAGVDYTKIEGFKMAMIEAAKRTARFPLKRNVVVMSDVLHSHGGIFHYTGNLPHMWCKTHEGLGNKNWIAEWMYQFSGTGRTYYAEIAYCNAMMAVNDVIAQGAMPVAYTDEVAAGDSEWFDDKIRAADLASGYIAACESAGMALVAGESPALKYLVHATEPVQSAPSLSGCVTGIIAPNSHLVTGKFLQPGDSIIGVASSGVHANGISLLIKRALTLPDQFKTILPNGRMLGEDILTPTKCYVSLIEGLLNNEIRVSALLPGTGGGVGKVAFDKRPMTYRIHSWLKVHELFLYMRELGVSLMDCLTTFNWGVGYYIFLPKEEVDKALLIAHELGYDAAEIGRVESGPRETIFEPEGGIHIPPPGE